MDEESRRERILPGASASFRKGRRGGRVAAKPRLKPARSREEPPPWSPKESPSPPRPGLHTKLGVGKLFKFLDEKLFFKYFLIAAEKAEKKISIERKNRP
jgi:hypothetical protein